MALQAHPDREETAQCQQSPSSCSAGWNHAATCWRAAVSCVVLAVKVVAAAPFILLFSPFLLPYVWALRNRLVWRAEDAKKAWGEIEVELSLRLDLIDNLVAIPRGLSQMQESILIELVEARGRVSEVLMSDTPLADRVEAISVLSGLLARAILTADAYPELRSRQRFERVRLDILETENSISSARHRYNEAVRAYNAAFRSWPASWMLSGLGLEALPYFGSSVCGKDAEVGFSRLG